MSPKTTLSKFLKYGKFKRWPRQEVVKKEALEYLASKFDVGTSYSEEEVDLLLLKFHTFSDPARLRRELYDNGYIDRTVDGERYWRY